MADAGLPRLRPPRPEEKGALLALLQVAFHTYDARLGRPFPPDVGDSPTPSIGGWSMSPGWRDDPSIELGLVPQVTAWINAAL